jgi:hypothetical protein
MMIYPATGAAFLAGLLALLRGRRASAAHDAPPPARGSAHPAPDDAPADRPAALAKVAAHRRTAYLPVVEDGDTVAAGSKLAGAPALAPGEAWPACAHCGRPMQLFVQLSGDELPAAARERVRPGELLQLFYCTSVEPHCEGECDAWSPHAESTLLRLVPAPPAGSAAPPVPPGMFPPRRIVGWTEVDDYPHYEEHGVLGVQLDDAEVDALLDSYPLPGEKLLGWPNWVQGEEYPRCRSCGSPMELLFQVDSEHDLPYMFGDVGTGHVTQCGKHREELAFGWACH